MENVIFRDSQYDHDSRKSQIDVHEEKKNRSEMKQNCRTIDDNITHEPTQSVLVRT